MHQRSPFAHHRPCPAVAAATALAVAAALVLACGPAPEPGPSTAGGPAPAFRLASLDGGEIGPQDYPGRVVLLEFWATWCIPCHAQADMLEPLYAEYRGRGVEFLAIDLGEDEETVRRFVAANPFPYPVLIDPADELSYELGVVALPTLMVIDRDGEVVYFEAGVVGENEVRRLLDEAGAEAA